jgi:hypothetical protein
VSNVIHLPVKRQAEHALTYDQLALYLHQRGLTSHPVSRRWLQLRRAEGMPHHVDRWSKRVMFVPSEAVEWLEGRAA